SLSRDCPPSGASTPAGRRGRSPAQSGGPRRAAPWRRATTASAGAPGRGRRAASDIARPPRGSAGRGSACTARPRRAGAPRGGARIPRNEEPALLRGQGVFVDDLQLPGMAHATMLRSPHANARIERINVRRARAAPGVLDVLTHADLGALGAPLPKLIPHPSLTHHK